MDAIKFIKLWKEMCDSYERCGDGCPFHSSPFYCRKVVQDNPEKVVEIVQKWEEENHPTIIDDFMKKNPQADREVVIESCCPNDVGYPEWESCGHGVYEGKCDDCWNRKI